MKIYIYLCIFLLLLTACAKQQPVLYPNSQLKAGGKAQADIDIAECEQLADQYVKSYPNNKVAKSTAWGGVTGTAGGAAAGVVTGGDVGTGALAGAAAGATIGLMNGIVNSSDPDPVYKSYIGKCLEDKGYTIVGWQ